MITSSKQIKIIVWVAIFIGLLLCLLLVFIFSFQYSQKINGFVVSVNTDQYLAIQSPNMANKLKHIHIVTVYFQGIAYQTKIAFYSRYNNLYYFATNLNLNLTQSNAVQVQINHLTLWEILH